MISSFRNFHDVSTCFNPKHQLEKIARQVRRILKFGQLKNLRSQPQEEMPTANTKSPSSKSSWEMLMLHMLHDLKYMTNSLNPTNLETGTLENLWKIGNLSCPPKKNFLCHPNGEFPKIVVWSRRIPTGASAVWHGTPRLCALEDR